MFVAWYTFFDVDMYFVSTHMHRIVFVYVWTHSMCFMFLQADNLPDIPSQTVTEEKYMDEHGNMVVKKVRETLKDGNNINMSNNSGWIKKYYSTHCK